MATLMIVCSRDEMIPNKMKEIKNWLIDKHLGYNECGYSTLLVVNELYIMFVDSENMSLIKSTKPDAFYISDLDGYSQYISRCLSAKKSRMIHKMGDVEDYILSTCHPIAFGFYWRHCDEGHIDDEVFSCDYIFRHVMKKISHNLIYHNDVFLKDIGIKMSRNTFDRLKKLVAYKPMASITIQSEMVGNHAFHYWAHKINGFDVLLNNYGDDNHCKFYIKQKTFYTSNTLEKLNEYDIASIYPSRAFREEYCGIFNRKENKNMTKEEQRMTILIDHVKNNSYAIAETCIKDYISENHNMDIKEVIYHDPATIILWKDGTKTVVKCQKDDIYDPEKGFVMAFMKKFYGNKGNFNDILRKWVPEVEAVNVKEITVAEYCKLNKCSVDVAYGRIKRGEVDARKINRKWYIREVVDDRKSVSVKSNK